MDKKNIKKILNRVKENTRMECIRIRTRVSEKSLPLTASKFGGTPYWPDINNYPVANKRKVYMTLLAQINFSDLPKNSVFPNKGLLQFFLLDNDWPSEYRVVYHKDIDESVTPLPCFHEGELDASKKINEYIPTTLMQDTVVVKMANGIKCSMDFHGEKFFWGDAGFPVIGELALDFSLEHDHVNMTEDCFEDEIREAAKQLNIVLPEYIDNGWTLLPEGETAGETDIFDDFLRGGHKLLGYPYFVQNDCKDDGDVLLLQMDSADSDSGETDNQNFIMFGDAGVGRFFIPYDDLKKLDFAYATYDWDCC